jgi:hypothetical protein
MFKSFLGHPRVHHTSWCLHSSGKEQHSCLDVVSCSVRCKKEPVYCVVESIFQLFIQLLSILVHLKKEITCWCCAHSGNLLWEFFYDLPEVVPHVYSHFFGK